MNRRAAGVAAWSLVAVAACGSPRPRAPTKLTAREIVQRSTPAIVRIEASGERIGTGFTLDPSGVIATNLHVVAGAREITVELLDGTKLPVMRIDAFDLERDLALIDVDPATPLPVIALGDSDLVAAGDPVIAIGNPMGVLEYSVSDGLISSVRVLSDKLTVLQISAPISQGSSGGPLFNSAGEVIGVSTAILSGGQNLNFGVPGNYLKQMLAGRQPVSLDEFASETAPPDPTVSVGNGVTIQRHVPSHPLAVLDGCSDDAMVEVFKGISEAIASGAPLYNAGNHEACYRIYEGTAIKFEREAGCKGVRAAFGDGLLRAGTLDSFTEKAWAMRDTFDGLIDVIERRAQAQQLAPAHP